MQSSELLSTLKALKRFLDENDLIGTFLLARKSRAILDKLCKEEMLGKNPVFSTLEEYKLYLSAQFYLQGKDTQKIAKELALIGTCQELLSLLNDMYFTTKVLTKVQKLRSLVSQLIQVYEDYLQCTAETNKE